MFPADCLPTNYIEARNSASKPSSSSSSSSQQKPHHSSNNNSMTSTKAKPLLLQPVPTRPAGPLRTISCPPRTLSSALFSLFPASGATLSASTLSSARTSPSGTPMPSPGLGGPQGRGGWFGVSSTGVARPRDQDITCLPPAWS